MTQDILGPFLVLDDIRDGQLHLAALFAAPEGARVPQVTTAEGDQPMRALARIGDTRVFRTRFAVPLSGPSEYRWNGETFALACSLSGDTRLAFVSCNGQENGHLDRPAEERNAMWARLRAEHDRRPFALLLHGGDQIYADEATLGHALSDEWPRRVPRDPSRADLEDLRRHLRHRFAERYLAAMQDPHYAHVGARVPSLAQWDDHDICDGWGSLRRSRTYSPVGQTLFDVAREMALLFQHATVAGDLPPRFVDREGLHLGWRVAAAGLAVLAPDLRSERTRRQVMGAGGWAMMQQAARVPANGRTFLLSTVPLLGPRLSVLEALMMAVPKMQEYEDDLRDQWQSRAHREEWKRMLRLVAGLAEDGGAVTALSGEIHLAAHASLDLGDGRKLHQLVASGISHPAPPKAWARTLGALANLGSSPLEGRPIRIHRMPGHRGRYVAERNFLILERQSGDWHAEWEFERSGRSPALAI